MDGFKQIAVFWAIWAVIACISWLFEPTNEQWQWIAIGGPLTVIGILWERSGQSRKLWKKKFLKQIGDPNPIIPKHDPPTKGWDDRENAFFAATEDFGEVINYQLNSYSVFRLQETKIYGVDLGLNGRQYLIYYNQSEVGRLKLYRFYVHPEVPEYHVEITLEGTRFMDVDRIRSFLRAVGFMIVDPSKDIHESINATINRALIDSMWEFFRVRRYFSPRDVPHVLIHEGELSISFAGKGWAAHLERVAKDGKYYRRGRAGVIPPDLEPLIARLSAALQRKGEA